jgi:hypothetical protein
MKITDANRDMFEIFASLHPEEAYDLDREAFYKWAKKKYPTLDNIFIDETIKALKEQSLKSES